MTQIEIKNIFNSPQIQTIVQADEFYFSKAREAIDKWLQLKVNEQMKDDLIRLSLDYTQFLEIAMINPEIEEIQELLLEIVSYCDNNARGKNTYNRYEDKRVLAKAAVRMGDWVSALVKLKFNHEEIQGNSIKNAFSYIQNPRENCTILSENHRKMLAENLFQQSFASADFVTQLKDYFSSYNLTVNHPENYTYLLSSIIYQMKNSWMEEVLGLMATDGTGWQDELLELDEDYKGFVSWNSKKPTMGAKVLKQLADLIKEGQTFPLFYAKGGMVHYKAEIVDFATSQDELNSKNWKELNLHGFLSEFDSYKDGNKKARILFFAEAMEQMDPISMNEFGFYGNAQKPRQDNLSPLKTIPEEKLISIPFHKREINYWIFQGNPNQFDFETALRENILDDWTVSAHKDKIKPGDKVILWITGKVSGCYALAEVTSEPYEKEQSADSHLWKTEDKNNTKVDITITHNWVDDPILKADLEQESILKNLKVGNQGTNFSATKDEYNYFLSLTNNPSDFHEFIKRFNPSDLAAYFEFLREIIKDFNIKMNDQRISFNYRRNAGNLSFTVGQRYCLSLDNNDNRGKFGFISKDKLFKESEQYKGNLPRPWYTYKNNLQFTHEEKQNIFEGIKVEYNRSDVSGFRKYNKEDFEAFIIENKRNATTMTNAKQHPQPLNQILYGPPGTGKTYTLKTEYFPLYTTTEAAITKDVHFENAVRDCSWWQVIAVALIQLGKSKVSAIAEHPWVVQKTNLSNSRTVRPTIWGQLQSHTIDSCEFVNVKSKQQPFIFNKTEDSYWEILEEEVKEQIPEIYELIDSVENFKPNPNKEIKRYVFTTFHRSFNYEDFIEGIKPIMNDDEGTGEVAYRIEDGVFKDLCKRAESDPNNRYAIFIDEINRGNVSAIFGELITLIETDKRKGAEHAMNAILPYSKAPFSVPVNVDIYGTMNTADRSIEALDTALRRRFSFTEMPPIYDIDEEKATLQYTYAGVVGSKLLETINNRIEKLLDRDHLIGHSYFLMAKGEDAEAKLIDSFYRNIIPLLQEYFYGDYAKIGAVLGSGFVFKNQEDSVIFGDGFNEEEYSDKDIYQIIDYRVANNPLIKTDMTFESAIQKLMNTPKEKASEPGA